MLISEDFCFLSACSLFAYLQEDPAPLVPRKRKRLQAIIAYGAPWVGRKAMQGIILFIAYDSSERMRALNEQGAFGKFTLTNLVAPQGEEKDSEVYQKIHELHTK